MLARLVDCDGMCCVVFALGAIGVDLFWILRFFFHRGKAGLRAGASFYPLSLLLGLISTAVPCRIRLSAFSYGRTAMSSFRNGP